ncbi:hypothetical protein [Pseudoduganella chitinolytica]|uniref:Lipoprotein n=1 Tax=Pseudoduganella chitinolytica TaxID=34070 RepID=A0ABY8B8D8_9BURK|nr:hypothetical protein [Pseudoduganella chitinolytica]WEF31266.1 hypothetical protein PX653_17585 [Pseudoduganella chitinolytica]
MKPLICACVVAILAACGGGGDHGSAGPVAPPVQPPVTAVDSFFAAVLAVFGKDEEGEPVAIEAAAATAPEGAEPQAVP